MDEYISREDVLSYIYATHSSGGFKREDDYLWLHDRVINAAAADVQPVKHGQWIWDSSPEFGNPYGSYVCSECDERQAHRENYCPNCGARMRIDDMDGDAE